MLDAAPPTPTRSAGRRRGSGDAADGRAVFVAYRRRRGGLEPPGRAVSLRPGFARVAVLVGDSSVEVVGARWWRRGRVWRRFDDPSVVRVVHDDGEGRHWVVLGVDCYWVPTRWVPAARQAVRIALTLRAMSTTRHGAPATDGEPTPNVLRRGA